MSFTVAHLDADSFYVQVARAGDPTLVGRPVAVGFNGPRGVIASASYEARAFGVTSAMPVSIAVRKCPKLVIVGVDSANVSLRSRQIWAVVRSAGLPFEQVGSDEGYLDLRGIRGDGVGVAAWAPVRLVERIRRRVAADCGIVISAGVSSGRVAAKIASARAKPDGLLTVAGDEVVAFLAPLPVTALPGVGPVAAGRLETIGVRTVSDLTLAPASSLVGVLGAEMAARLTSWAAGEHLGGVDTTKRAVQSISAEETLAVDTGDPVVLAELLGRLSAQVAGRLFQAGLGTSRVTTKVRSADFQDRSAGVNVVATDDWATIVEAAGVALAKLTGRTTVRLVGVTASNLTSGTQPTLIDMGPMRAAATSVRVGVVVSHPVFGDGLVELVDDGDATVRFADMTRVIELRRLVVAAR